MNTGADISITGLGCLTALGHDLPTHRDALDHGRTAFRPLAELPGIPAEFHPLAAAWITPRALLSHRKWAPASRAALHAARQAVADSGWSPAELKDAVVFAGTSRGTLAGAIDPWPGRRAFPLMAASNSLHSEPAAAVSAELGIEGPWQTQSSGCCASLDALGLAALWLAAGRTRRALVVAVDLPLTPTLLKHYARTGILSSNGLNHPYSPATTGILPAEGAAALCLETGHQPGKVRLIDYLGNTDTADPLASHHDAAGLRRLLTSAAETHGPPTAIIPHASGTPAQAASEPAAIRQTLGAAMPIHPLKPWTGHTIGASGLIESTLLISYLQQQQLPPAFPPADNPLPHLPIGTKLPPESRVFKLASAMGGRAALTVFQSPHESQPH